ncbi:hypothetical protein, partial [Pseudoalteromonas sp. S1650]|uniref:hypothetical protein n=1 Tax=Pseudoalteromonas sp. S1650 TaxID=579509 RepID=UPI00110B6366
MDGNLVVFALALANELWAKQSLVLASQATTNANRLPSDIINNAVVAQAKGIQQQLTEPWQSEHLAGISPQTARYNN